MKRIFKNIIAVSALIASLFFTSCSSNIEDGIFQSNYKEDDVIVDMQ